MPVWSWTQRGEDVQAGGKRKVGKVAAGWLGGVVETGGLEVL